jgi:hypothetical protein
MAGRWFSLAVNKVSAYFGRWNEDASTAVFITGFDAVLAEDGIALIRSLSANEHIEPVTSIRYTVPRTSHVTVEVYSTSGELVRTLSNGMAPAGTGEVTWDGRNDKGVPVSSGIYFYRLRVDKVTLSRKMVLMR